MPGTSGSSKKATGRSRRSAANPAWRSSSEVVQKAGSVRLIESTSTAWSPVVVMASVPPWRCDAETVTRVGSAWGRRRRLQHLGEQPEGGGGERDHVAGSV